MTYNQALEIDRLSGVNGIDRALADFDLDAVIAPTDNPAWATDLLYGDHFLFGSSGLAAGAGNAGACAFDSTEPDGRLSFRAKRGCVCAAQPGG